MVFIYRQNTKTDNIDLYLDNSCGRLVAFQ